LFSLNDTDILIWIQRGNAKAAELVNRAHTRCISIVSAMELLQAASNKARREDLLFRPVCSFKNHAHQCIMICHHLLRSLPEFKAFAAPLFLFYTQKLRELCQAAIPEARFPNSIRNLSPEDYQASNAHSTRANNDPDDKLHILWMVRFYDFVSHFFGSGALRPPGVSTLAVIHAQYNGCKNNHHSC